MFSTLPYFNRVYHRLKYNCLHFTYEVWQALTGEDLQKLITIQLKRSELRNFIELDKPEEPCLVVFQSRFESPHIGIWLRGKVFHLCSAGVRHTELKLASYGFDKVRFVKCRK